MRKNIIIGIIIIALVAIGIGVYFAWQKSNQNVGDNFDQTNNQAVNQAGNYSGQMNSISPILPANGKIKLLSKNNALAYWITNLSTSTQFQSQDIFYISEDGSVNKISGTSEDVIGKENLGSVKFAKPLFNANKVLIVFKKANSLIPEVFDIDKKIWRPLSGDELITAVDLSPDGKKMAYTIDNFKGGVDLFTIDLSNEKGKGVKLITLNIKDFDIKWVSDNTILFASKPSFDYSSEIWKFDLKTKTLSKIIESNGLIVNWSKFGDLGLKFSSAQNRSYSFSLIDNSGNSKGSFKFITFPDKCLISSPSQIYCAIPRDQSIFSTNATFPDDYLKRAVYFKEGIYQVDVGQNKFQALFEEESPIIDAINLSLYGSKLLFINRYDGKLYSLEI